MYAFPAIFMVFMIYTFLNRPFYTQHIKLGKQKNTFSSILHKPSICSVNPTCSIEKDVKGFRLTRFFLNEISQMSKFKFFVSGDKFSITVQILSLTEKFKNQKILLKNSWKTGTPFCKHSWKIGMPLARWNTKLNNWHTFCTLTRLMARSHVKMRSWHAFGTLTHTSRWHAWHVWHAIWQTPIRFVKM